MWDSNHHPLYSASTFILSHSYPRVKGFLAFCDLRFLGGTFQVWTNKNRTLDFNFSRRGIAWEQRERGLLRHRHLQRVLGLGGRQRWGRGGCQEESQRYLPRLDLSIGTCLHLSPSSDLSLKYKRRNVAVLFSSTAEQLTNLLLITYCADDAVSMFRLIRTFMTFPCCWVCTMTHATYTKLYTAAPYRIKI